MTALQREIATCPPESATAHRRFIVLALAVFTILWLAAAATSRGFGPADGCMHYLFARFALRDPHNLVDVWARPICTAWYALPAALGGRVGVCAASWLLGIGCAVIAYRLAVRQGVRLAALAFLFTLCQPLLFLHTLTVMTELPFAVLLGVAFLAYQNQRWLWAAFALSFTPLARPEGFGFLLLAGVGFIAGRQWKALLILPVGLLTWAMAGWLISGREGMPWMWLMSHWPYARTSMYGHGNPLTFIAELPVIVSPAILPATLAGIWLSLSPEANRFSDCHVVRCRRLTALIPISILIVHSALYATGKMASDGEARYLLVAAPLWGVLGARGWEWLATRLDWNHPLRWAAVAALTPLLANSFYPVVPLRPTTDWETAARFAEWYKTSGLSHSYPTIGAAHPGVFYSLDRSPTHGGDVIEWTRAKLLSPVSSILLVWDPIYSSRNASPDRTIQVDELLRAGWVEDPEANRVLNQDRDVSADPKTDWHVLHAR